MGRYCGKGRVTAAAILMCAAILQTAMRAEAQQQRDGVSGYRLVLVMDVSGSMKATDPDLLCREAAGTLIRDAAQEELHDGGRAGAGIIFFSDRIEAQLPVTALDVEGEEEVLSFLDRISFTDGDTDLGLALGRAIQMLEGQGDGAASVILITDGVIDLPQEEDEEKAEKDSLTAALLAAEKARSAGIRIHTAVLDPSGTVDTTLPGYLAERTGGRFLRADSPELLGDLLSSLKADMLEQMRAEQEESEAQTEAQTEAETEAATEMETETETDPPVIVAGSVNGPVTLRGLYPGSARARIDLSGLFAVDLSGSPASSLRIVPAMTCEAASGDANVASCEVEGQYLVLSSGRSGSTSVRVSARAGDGEGAQTEIAVRVSTLFSSFTAACAAMAAAAGLIAVLLLLLVRKMTAGPLEGVLRWYVKTQGQKIFGVPSMQCADLSDYRSGVRLSELISDPYLEGVPLHRIRIRRKKIGQELSSSSSLCVIESGSRESGRKTVLVPGTSVRIRCEGEQGRAYVILIFEGGSMVKEEEEEERTRLLV